MSDAKTEGKSFVEGLDEESLKYFSEVGKKPFSQQAVFVLNAFYNELQDQADAIYHVAWEVMKMADMRVRNVQYLHLYEEGHDLDFDMALYFFEQLVKFYEDPKNKQWQDEKYARSRPVQLTAIVRKKEIRERVDVNFDGRVSFLEYLLYQYNLSPKSFVTRSNVKDEGPVNEALIKARLALDEVNKRIVEYETYKAKLEQEAKLPGVKGLKATNELAQLLSGTLAENLRTALIKAESAVRLAAKFGASIKPSAAGGPVPEDRTKGEVWWMNTHIATKKKLYAKKE